MGHNGSSVVNMGVSEYEFVGLPPKISSKGPLVKVGPT